jgi:hypothetical protein
MKKNLFKLSFTIFAVCFFWSASPVKAEMATTTIHLQIKTYDVSLYDADIDVTACTDSATATTTSVNGKCAVEQSGLVNDWSWWGEDVFLNSIGSYINNDADNGVYWGWFSNLDYGLVALNKHLLSEGEKLLLTYNINPLRISVSSTTPFINATTTMTLEQFGLDASWNPAWLPAASSTLVIDGAEVKNVSGIYEYVAATTTPASIYGKKDGFIDSDSLIIAAAEPVVPVIPDKNSEQENPSPITAGGAVIITSGGGGGGLQITTAVKVDLVKAADFLNAEQNADGSFGSVLITDWAAIALASFNPNSQASSKIKSYLLIDPDPLVGLNPASDYSRRAMALMSLNINPYNGTKTNYIKKIISFNDGRQFGDASLYNDDIFALIVLAKAGYTVNDKIIQEAANFIISKQLPDGSWGSTDLTAAAIQALKPVSTLTGISEALVKARNFLINSQLVDSGFGNTYTTAWVIQAIAALGEDPSAWLKNGNTPESFLALSQGADGGLEKDYSYDVNRVWSTAYAIPAIQNKPWFNILNSFSKENLLAEGEVGANKQSAQNNLIASSTLESLDLASSSPEILSQASSTEAALTIEAGTETESEIKVEEKPKELIKPAVKPIKALKPKVLSVKISEPKPDLPAKEIKEDEEKPIVKAEINESNKKTWLTTALGAIFSSFYQLGLKFLSFLL